MLPLLLLLAAPPESGPQASAPLACGSAKPVLALGDPAGEVKLPLRDYLAMVDKARAEEAAKAQALRQVEPAVAEITSQQLRVEIGESVAEVTTVFEVEVRGATLQPVLLPLPGLAHKLDVLPARGAALHRVPEGLQLVATVAGHYQVTALGQAPLRQQGGLTSLALPALGAAVVELEASFPQGLLWHCAGAVAGEDTTRGGRRHLRLALPRSQATTLELRRENKGAEAEKALASAVVVTILELGRDAAWRHDVVLYEVARGELDSLHVTLPEGLAPSSAATDEGETPPLLEGREVRVDRQRKLGGTGYLVLTSPVTGATLALDPVQPTVRVRGRYLAVASSVAADVTPRPEASWSRVDLGDLPALVSEAAQALDIVAAWRLRADATDLTLAISALPAASLLETLVKERDSMSLLTVEGTLLHRDRFTIDGSSSALALRLPEGATLWSALANGVSVRPVELAGETLIPLGFAHAQQIVEVVLVVPQKLAAGRSRISLALPELQAPVLLHRWRLLLPEGNRYRYATGSLPRAVEPVEPARRVGGRLEPAALPPPPAKPQSVTASGALEERVQVGGELNASDLSGIKDKVAQQEQQAQSYRDNANLLKQGLVGGVKPVPVAVPESGKLLFLAGALPPPRVTVELEVKHRAR